MSWDWKNKYDQFVYGEDSVSIGDMTVGYSGKGMEQFSESLKQMYVEDVKKELESLRDDIITELGTCWTGESKKTYVGNLRAGIEAVEKELLAEWNDLASRLTEIGQFYVQEDKKLAE